MSSPALMLVVILTLGGCASKAEVAWQTIHAYDALQTLRIAKSDCYYEDNPVTRSLIGKHPSQLQVGAWYASTAVLHALVSKALEGHKAWYTAWQSVSIGISGYTVAHNHSIGIRPFRSSSC